MGRIMVAVVIAVMALACSGHGGDGGGMPTVDSPTGSSARNITCEPYNGCGDSVAYRNGPTLRQICDDNLCFIDGACFYGCPESLSFPTCAN